MIAEMSRYYEYSRATYYAVVAALPLLLAYELLLSLGGDVSQGQVRNAADVWLRTIFISLGVSPSKATLVMILAVILAIPVVRSGAPPLVARFFSFMLLEALAYGFALGVIINYILAFFFSFSQAAQAAVDWTPLPAALPVGGGLSQGLALSLGAGLFEELVFRVILLNLLLYMSRLILPRWPAITVSIAGAAFLFSLAHYVGPLGEPFELRGFLFRWIAGLLFTSLFYLRGFAITAYSHAIYDVWVITGLFRLVGW